MELLFIVLIGIGFGLIGRAVLPRRDTTGVALLPALGGASAAIVWVALTWARLPWDAPGIWVLTIVASVLTVVGGGMLLGRARTRSDAARFPELMRPA